MNWTERQIELSRELAEEIEKKTGVKRVPKVGEWWFFDESEYFLESDGYMCGLIIIKNIISYCIFEPSTQERINVKNPLHPLFTEGDCLEIIKRYFVCEFDSIEITPHYVIFHTHITTEDQETSPQVDIKSPINSANSEDLLTALLELAVKVVKGGEES